MRNVGHKSNHPSSVPQHIKTPHVNLVSTTYYFFSLQLAVSRAWAHALLCLLLLHEGCQHCDGNAGEAAEKLKRWSNLGHNLIQAIRKLRVGSCSLRQRRPLTATTSEPLQQAFLNSAGKRNRRKFLWRYVPISQVAFPAERQHKSYYRCRQKRKMQSSSPLQRRSATGAGKWLWNRGSDFHHCLLHLWICSSWWT